MGAFDLKRQLLDATQRGNLAKPAARSVAVRREDVAEHVPEAEANGDNYADMLAELDSLVHSQASVPPSSAQPAPPTALIAASAAPATPPPTGGNSTVAQGMALVNLTHFVAPFSGESTIWREGTDSETGMHAVLPVSSNSFKLTFAPFTVNVLTPGGAKAVQLADVWVRSKNRREYPGGVVLQPEGTTQPGTYNLFRGFGVDRKAGNADPMLSHIDMLCGGSRELTEYVLNWLAFCVQRPGSRPEVALVFRGGQGTGKGTAVRVMLVIFGRHQLHLTQPKHLVGNFNSHLRSALFLFVDEGHWPGDKSSEGVLKALITEPTIAIEMKGRDVFTATNRLKMVIASNNAWVVPAGADERRYCVVDVPATRAQDHDYFGKLNDWIDADGASIFLDHLLSRDLSGFNIRAVPKTAALDLQKIEGMSTLDRWIMEALDTSTGLACGEWVTPHRIKCEAALNNFDLYRRRSAVRGQPADARIIGRRLGEVFGCGPATMGRATHGTRVREWAMPDIAQARAAAAAAFGLAQYIWGQV